jgi:prevent-host-death family protein
MSARRLVLQLARLCYILVNMTRKEIDRTGLKPPRRRRKVVRSARSTHWILQDAKARFSELVRRAHREGPQHVTVHGRDEVVVISVGEYRRLRGDRPGQLLVDLLRDSPLSGVPIEPAAVRSPVRDVEL